jgi:hypothetical protein
LEVNTATVYTLDPGYVQAVFRHPAREDLFIVVTDWMSQFPGREDQAAAVASGSHYCRAWSSENE